MWDTILLTTWLSLSQFHPGYDDATRYLAQRCSQNREAAVAVNLYNGRWSSVESFHTDKRIGVSYSKIEEIARNPSNHRVRICHCHPRFETPRAWAKGQDFSAHPDRRDEKELFKSRILSIDDVSMSAEILAIYDSLSTGYLDFCIVGTKVGDPQSYTLTVYNFSSEAKEQIQNAAQQTAQEREIVGSHPNFLPERMQKRSKFEHLLSRLREEYGRVHQRFRDTSALWRTHDGESAYRTFTRDVNDKTSLQIDN